MKGLYVSFWGNEFNKHLKSHNKGLTKEQIEELKNLKEGDRLILFKNDREGENQPEYNLKVSRPMPQDDSGL